MAIQQTLATNGMPSPTIEPYSLKTFFFLKLDEKIATFGILKGLAWLIINE
jgi:hypothetical protein